MDMIGPDPVQNRHKVIGDHPKATSGEILHALFIVLYKPPVIPPFSLDVLVDRKAFYYRPFQAGLPDHALPFQDVTDTPHLPYRDLVQGGDHLAGPGLGEI